MNYTKYIGIALIGALVFVAVYELVRVRRLISIGNTLADNAQRYEQPAANDDALQFLFVGDSSAVGTGALVTEESTAGQLGHDFPNAGIRNIAVNGAKIEDALVQLSTLDSGDRFDVMVIQIGGNDIVRRTSLTEMEQGIEQLLDRAQTQATHVLLLHGGDVGTAPLLPLGTHGYMSRRTDEVRDMYMRVTAQRTNVYYIDIYPAEGESDPFADQTDRFYARDYFHPGTEGYAYWYDHISAQLDELDLQ